MVLLDLRLPDMLGPEVVQALRARTAALKIILFTAYPDHAALGRGPRRRARTASWSRTPNATTWSTSIRRVVAGERVVQHRRAGSSGAALSRKLREHGLTRREYDILRHVAMGETNPEIAVALGLTRNTVKTYLQRSLEKLGARNRVEALSRASQLGIL